jgi:hypothetical protein
MQGPAPIARLGLKMNYSICLLDAGGRTKRTDFGPFDNDVAALAQARTEVADSPIVEVWKDDRLVARFYRDPEPSEVVQ